MENANKKVKRKTVLSSDIQDWLKNDCKPFSPETFFSQGNKQDGSQSDNVQTIFKKVYDENLSFSDAVNIFKRAFISHTKRLNNNNISKTCDHLKMNRKTFYNECKRLQLV